MNTNSFGLPTALPGTKNPVRMWAPLHEVDYAAQHQIRTAANLPWTHGVAIMPDVHPGNSVTVGCVIAMHEAVAPQAVGVDIGCGMMAVRSSATLDDLPADLAPLRSSFEAVVPVGFAKHATYAGVLKNQGWLRRDVDKLFARFSSLKAEVSSFERTARRQCGTLGGGNHFIELCVGPDEHLWVMLHSGSRGVGKLLAEQHIAKAKTLEWNSSLPDRDLAVFLHRDETGQVLPEWSDYLHDLMWAQDYAAMNREVMMASIMQALRAHLPGVCFDTPVNCHHNYVSQETYDGVELIVTRKGAISARSGQLGIIPGSMGTGGFIVEGLGNEAAYCSASHGAGRRMSRGQARQVFTLADLAEQTAGVECRKDRGVLDEIPGAYKDLNQVLAHEEDLVRVHTPLQTLLSVKG